MRSSRFGSLAMYLDSDDTPLVLLCPAWKKYGTATTVKPNTTILHSRSDDVVPFADSEELVRNSGLHAWTLVETGSDHRLADTESLEMMLEACLIGEDEPLEKEDILQRDWTELCYTAALLWAGDAEHRDWLVVHGSVLSERVGKRIEHAWCERGETVVDLALPVGARIVECERYYRVVQPEVSRTYSSDNALLLAIHNNHDGPWNESEQLKE